MKMNKRQQTLYDAVMVVLQRFGGFGFELVDEARTAVLAALNTWYAQTRYENKCYLSLSDAARVIGITPSAVKYRMRKFGFDYATEDKMLDNEQVRMLKDNNTNRILDFEQVDEFLKQMGNDNERTM